MHTFKVSENLPASFLFPSPLYCRTNCNFYWMMQLHCNVLGKSALLLLCFLSSGLKTAKAVIDSISLFCIEAKGNSQRILLPLERWGTQNFESLTLFLLEMVHGQQRHLILVYLQQTVRFWTTSVESWSLGKKKNNKRGNDTNLKTLVAKLEIVKYIKEERAYLNKSQLALILSAE